MKITLRAGGVIRSGSERLLIDEYLKRADGLTKACGYHSVSEQQIDLRKAKSRQQETELLLDQSPPGVTLIILDERGKSLTSRQIARTFEDNRESGVPEVIIAIGGADGFDPSAIPQGTAKWALGTQTWPHKLVRVMMAEQIYRALSILAGTPYHRD